MSFLPFAISPLVRSTLGLFRHSSVPCTAIAPFSTTIICRQEPGTHDPDALLSKDNVSYFRYRYRNDPDFRRAQILRSRLYPKTPHRREQLRKAHAKHNHIATAHLRSLYKESSAYRRKLNLTTFIPYHFKNGRLDKYWSWKTHAPLVYPSRVEHHCTACDRVRLLKIWWKEKPITPTPAQNRYMCTPCFASDPERMMPEKYPAKLPDFFTDTVDKRSNP